MVDGLVVETVDGKVCSNRPAYYGVFFGCNKMGGQVSRCVLTVLQQWRIGKADTDVLVETATKCCCKHLHAAANAEYRYLTVESKLSEQ